jgi:hypothetical protein
MTTWTKLETHKALKPHRCSWCYERIETGEMYTRYRCFDSGDACTVKMHPECLNAMQDEATNLGGHTEWFPGENERPSREGKS